MDEIDYDDGIFEVWRNTSPTRRLARAYLERVRIHTERLESAAANSADADVREAMAHLHASRLVLAELEGRTEVANHG